VNATGPEIQLGRNGDDFIINGPIAATGGGNVRIQGDWVNNDLISIDGGGTLRFDGTYQNNGLITSNNSHVRLGGQFTIAELGDFSRTGGTVTINGTLDNAAGLTLDATTGSWRLDEFGTILGGVIETLDGTSLVGVSEFSGCCTGKLDGVTLEGRLDIVSSAAVAIVNDLTVNGLVVINGGTGSLGAAMVFGTTPEQTLDGTGTVILGGGDNSVSGSSALTIGPGIAISSQNGNVRTSLPLIINGPINTNPPGTTTLGQNGSVTTINGTISDNAGSNLRFEGEWVLNTPLVFDGGGNLRLGGTYQNNASITMIEATVDLYSEFTLAELGTFNRTGGSVNLRGTLQNTAGLILNATTGGWNLGDSGRIVGGTIETLDGIQLVVTGNSTLDGVTLNGTAGVLSGGILNIVNGCTLNGTISLNTNGSFLYGNLWFQTTPQQTIDGTGTIIMGGGVSRLEGSSQVTFGPGITITGGNGSIGPSAPMIIQGTVRPNIGGTIRLGESGTSWSNEGTLEVRAGSTLHTFQSWTNSGTFDIAPGSAATAANNYTQSSSGTLAVEISGTASNQIGRLAVTGNASLAGTLEISLGGGFVPNLGDMFTILTSTTSVSGVFDTITGADIGNGTKFQVNVLATSVQLEVVSNP
jgi:hypothetical protein